MLIGLVSLIIMMLIISTVKKYKGYDRSVMYITENDFERIVPHCREIMKLEEEDVFIL